LLIITSQQARENGTTLSLGAKAQNYNKNKQGPNHLPIEVEEGGIQRMHVVTIAKA
jgi:hypothetical protein